MSRENNLTAPPHLRGRMSRATPQALLDERATWMIERYTDGASQRAIARALGLSAPAVQNCLHKRGVYPRGPKTPFAHELNLTGLRLGGSMTSLFNGLPGKLRDVLIDEAARGDGTICGAIAQRLIEDMKRNTA